MNLCLIQEMKEHIINFIESKKEEAAALSTAIFEHPEVAGHEVFSSDALCQFLKNNGFAIEKGLGSQATAFRASYGTEGLCIGFLAEYDALDGLQQSPQPKRDGNGGPGHGCGHNLLGVGSCMAAAALKEALVKSGIPGRIVVYGTPAEETLYGKTCLRKEGFFKDLDVALTWHPGAFTCAGELRHKAMHSVVFSFQGRTAHASVCPEKGRSALDACEVLNIGANYLREHVPEDVRIHYAYKNSSIPPNVVPDKAAVWYFLRANHRVVADDVLQRMMDAARGAALICGVQSQCEVLASSDHTRINTVLARCAYSNMQEIGMPRFDEKDYRFAQSLAEAAGIPEMTGEIDHTITPLTGGPVQEHGSTDFSEVSQVLPALEMFAVCYPKGTPGHHWTTTACAGSAMAHKGLLFAAKVLACTALDCITIPGLYEEVRRAFENTD